MGILRTGVYSAALGLVGAGLTEIAPSQVLIGYILIAAGIGLAVWGIEIKGEHWWIVAWRKFTRSKLPPSVYVRNTDAKTPPSAGKEFRIEWIEKELSLTFRGEGSDGRATYDPPLEPTMTFDLFNAGEEVVRHIAARWRLSNPKLADDAALLGPNIFSIEGGALKMKSASGSARIMPLSANANSEPHPSLDCGETIQLSAPPSFTNAYSIRALALAKRHALQLAAHGAEVDPLLVLETMLTPMDTAFIDLTYVANHQTRRHLFAIVGRVWGGGPPFIAVNNEGHKRVFESTPGIVAVVDNVGVFHHDQ